MAEQPATTSGHPTTPIPTPRAPLVPRLERQHPAWLMALVFAMLLLAGVGDHLTGLDVRFFVMYFVPIWFAAWFVGARSGQAAALISTSFWVTSEILGGRVLPSPWVWVWNTTAMTSTFLLVSLGVSRMRQDRDHFRALATHDPVTNLLNGRGFLQGAKVEVERARRYGHPISLAYLDLDGFKLVNDTFGHAAGDALLRNVGRAIRSRIRRLDKAARIGGDEFAILLPQTTESGAAAVVERVRTAIANLPEALNAGVTASIGLVTFPVPPPGGAEEIVRLADNLMYQSKQNGKNRMLSRTV